MAVSRMIALVIVSIGLAFLLHFFDSQKIAEINSTPPDAYIMNELNDINQHNGYFVDFIVSLLLGAFYLGAVEIAAYLVRKTLRRYFISNWDTTA